MVNYKQQKTVEIIEDAIRFAEAFKEERRAAAERIAYLQIRCDLHPPRVPPSP
ncbi:hypothetical protein [Rhizobium sp. LC145]|uniref:hypothetical protein n=1 Tax=Rhizobium sp. LC145 TaxID=1120688 RepID=UPI000AC76358|nr:hypothetical protein [Rhizobium sp. LC145]